MDVLGDFYDLNEMVIMKFLLIKNFVVGVVLDLKFGYLMMFIGYFNELDFFVLD